MRVLFAAGFVALMALMPASATGIRRHGAPLTT